METVFPKVVACDGAMVSEEGLSLRDYFACQALVNVVYDDEPYNIATKAYAIADAMLDARNKK